MDIQYSAIKELRTVLEDLGIPYALIGGVAVQMWGEPRYTQDVDVTVVLNMAREVELIHTICERLTPRISDAATFARDNRVLLVRSSSGCPIDISLGLPGYEEELLTRAIDVDLAPDLKAVKMCTPEDLIIMKLIAGRARDIDDVESIFIRRKYELDRNYLQTRLAGFSDFLEMPELLERLEKIELSIKDTEIS